MRFARRESPELAPLLNFIVSRAVPSIALCEVLPMTIPAELGRYREPRKSEDNFIQKLLKPLLQRLGYYSVRDYQGTREFGKDLVFAEVDKFAEISYHGLQAKYEDSISLTMAED